jgi:3-deoxy-D-arabino-heptulosonate 7-phosphate (DAHP) synthase class II
MPPCQHPLWISTVKIPFKKAHVHVAKDLSCPFTIVVGPTSKSVFPT